MSATKKILLDIPAASRPASFYSPIASAFATIISQSRPNFAVGIFGSWGSGKTTLMTAIKKSLPTNGIIAVDFNAWRFQSEPLLLIPLLDTIRSALVSHAKPESGKESQLHDVARRIGKVVRALAAGLSGSVGIPGAITVNYDAGQAIAAIDEITADRDTIKPQSLYVAAFQELQESFLELTAAGISRIVVFVDDLDRCLPGQALAALESMKLFFELPGFIFVAGLDEDTIDRGLRARFAAGTDGLAPPREEREEADDDRLAREYAKKIFQVPYSIPVVPAQDLGNLLESMYREADLEDEQIADLQQRVRPYLEHIIVHRIVNPKEVKRFINGYTLQTLIQPELDPDVILALQTIAFREKWEDVYVAINSHPEIFREALRKFRDGDHAAFEDALPGLQRLPAELSIYLNSRQALPLAEADSLDPYLSCLRSVH